MSAFLRHTAVLDLSNLFLLIFFLRASCLYRTLTRAEGIWDYQIKGIDSGNCRFVASSGGSGVYSLLRLAETISEMGFR
jgi:hypothetical protein